MSEPHRLHREAEGGAGRSETPFAITAAEVQEQLRVAAQRHHALQSLLELGHELTVALDVYETADLLLFNLMGQLGTSRSALWLQALDDEEHNPVLVRAHGFNRGVVEAIGTACAPSLQQRFNQNGAPALSWALLEQLGAIEFELVRKAEIAIFAPVQARGELLGWLALGPRVDGSSYGQANLQVLEAALGFVAVSLQNARLYTLARESNRRLRATNEHLSELDRLKTEFLSNVNHELRTPLAVVLATLECVVDQGVPDASTQELLVGSLEQSRKLHQLIENLLMFSEVRNARLAIHAIPDDVGTVLDACLEERLPGVTAGLREMTYRCDENLPKARFDRQRLLQIMNELIDNAVKFTPRGSRIELSAERWSDNGTDWVRIEMRDNGPGIPPQRMDSLFKSFEQVDGSATRTVGGLGMGLAFANELGERMGCRLSATSTFGHGSTFRILLPVA
jgi:signal transduction histidine kinase